jgi:hypothetical protein
VKSIFDKLITDYYKLWDDSPPPELYFGSVEIVTLCYCSNSVAVLSGVSQAAHQHYTLHVQFIGSTSEQTF